MKRVVVLTLCFYVNFAHSQTSHKLFFPQGTFLKNSFIFKEEIYNAKIHSQGLIMNADCDSVFANNDCIISKIFPVAGSAGIIELKVQSNLVFYLGPFKSINVIKNEVLKLGSFIGNAENHETDSSLYSLGLVILKDERILSIDEHLQFLKLIK